MLQNFIFPPKHMQKITLFELEELINAKCNQISVVVEDKVTLRRIKPYKREECDEFGCNWGVGVIGDVAYADSIRSALVEFMKQYLVI